MNVTKNVAIVMTGSRRGLSSTFLPKQDDHRPRAPSCPEYEEAIFTLNSLQTFIKLPKAYYKQSKEIIELMGQWLKCLGHSVEDLSRLKAVHVAGTKGKGSTCAFVESILRHRGLRTGLFTSPHLRQARERFRIDGNAISPQMFAKYLFSVHSRLKDNSKLPLPGYFHFLTLMAMDLFLSEKVDVAVIEVGLGGEYDATNILKSPMVCGITTLGLDHTAVLGETLPEIAWHKAGIFKKGVPAFTEPQAPEAMTVLNERASEVNCSLSVVQPSNATMLMGGKGTVKLGLDGKIQLANASLAIQLAQSWLKNQTSEENIHFSDSQPEALETTPSQQMLAGLRETKWPGRFQRISRSPFEFWLDGAHTSDSIQLCADWFFNSIDLTIPRVLIFNVTGIRPFEEFLNIFINQNKNVPNNSFSGVIFSPTLPYVPPPVDHAYKPDHHKAQIETCERMKKFWLETNSFKSDFVEAVENTEDAVILIESKVPQGCQILVTGSLHLVGALLTALDEPID